MIYRDTSTYERLISSPVCDVLSSTKRARGYLCIIQKGIEPAPLRRNTLYSFAFFILLSLH